MDLDVLGCSGWKFPSRNQMKAANDHNFFLYTEFQGSTVDVRIIGQEETVDQYGYVQQCHSLALQMNLFNAFCTLNSQNSIEFWPF